MGVPTTQTPTKSSMSSAAGNAAKGVASAAAQAGNLVKSKGGQQFINGLLIFAAVVSLILPWVLFPSNDQEAARKNGLWGTQLILFLWAFTLGPCIISLAWRLGFTSVWGNSAIFVFVFLGWLYDYLSFFQDQTRFSEEPVCITGGCRANSNITGIGAMTADVMALIESADNIKKAQATKKAEQATVNKTLGFGRVNFGKTPPNAALIAAGNKGGIAAVSRALTGVPSPVAPVSAPKAPVTVNTPAAQKKSYNEYANVTAGAAKKAASAALENAKQMGPLGAAMSLVMVGMISAFIMLVEEYKAQAKKENIKGSGRNPGNRTVMYGMTFLIIVWLLYCAKLLFTANPADPCSCKPLVGANKSTIIFAMMWALGVGIITFVNEVWSNLQRFCTSDTQNKKDNGYKCQNDKFLDINKFENWISKLPKLRFGSASFRGWLNLGLSFINIFTAWQTIAQTHALKMAEGAGNSDFSSPAAVWSAFGSNWKNKDLGMAYKRDVVFLTLLFPTYTNYINTSFQFTGKAADLKLPDKLNHGNTMFGKKK